MEPFQPELSRRSFLQWSGLIAGAGLAAPFLSPQAFQPSLRVRDCYPSQPAQFSLMIPDSSIDPTLTEQFITGLDLGFRHQNSDRSMDWSLHRVGTTPASAYEIARTVIGSGVKLVLWLSDTPLSSSLRRLFEENQVPLLMSGAGANLLRGEDNSPFVFHHTLGYWQAAWALGNLAAGQLGKRAWIFSSLYDSGYDTPFSFQLGFEAAGGIVLGSSITHMKNSDLFGAIKNLQTVKPDFAVGFYCGAPAREFLLAWDEIGLRISLIGGGGMHGQGIHSARAWVPGLAGELADQFRSEYPALGSPTADDFGLLGFEAAGLLETALCAVDRGKAASLRNALESVQVESPRGIIQMDRQTHLASGPLFRLAGGESGEVQVLPMPKPDNPRVQSLRASVKTGWSHAYLFV